MPNFPIHTVDSARRHSQQPLVAIAVPLLASSVLQIAAVKLDRAFQPQVWTRTA